MSAAKPHGTINILVLVFKLLERYNGPIIALMVFENQIYDRFFQPYRNGGVI